MEDGEVAVFLFIQTSINHINTLHYIIAVDLTTAPTLRLSAVLEARSWPVSGAKKKCL